MFGRRDAQVVEQHNILVRLLGVFTFRSQWVRSEIPVENDGEDQRIYNDEDDDQCYADEEEGPVAAELPQSVNVYGILGRALVALLCLQGLADVLGALLVFLREGEERFWALGQSVWEGIQNVEIPCVAVGGVCLLE